MSWFKDVQEVNWHKAVWLKGFALNYAIYAWLATIEGLKTSDTLAQRGFGTLLNCMLCDHGMDSHMHLFFSCPFSLNLI